MNAATISAALGIATWLTLSSATAGDDPTTAKPVLVDLKLYGNHLLDDDMDQFEGNNLKGLPRGEQTFLGTKFLIGDSLIRLTRGEPADGGLDRARGIEVRAKAGRLVFLHGTEYHVDLALDEADREIGSYVVRYEDGAEAKIPIVYGRDLMDWWGYPHKPDPAAVKIAWKGTNPAVEAFDKDREITVRLFAMTWTNPHPDKQIAAVDFAAKPTRCHPFLVALTAEPPGAKAPPAEEK